VEALIVPAVIIIVLFIFFFQIIPTGLWIQALTSDVPVNPLSLIGMRLRRIPPNRIIQPLIAARKAGLADLTQNQLEAHLMARGDVDKVVSALIEAKKANIPLNFDQASGIDLAGRDVLEGVRAFVKPKVIQTPMVQGVAQDGIQLLATARITVRVKIDRLVGGAGEETIIARVGEGIVSSIGSALTHNEVLEYPDKISKTVLAKGLDAGTAFEILSIDISEVDVGKNIGAQLRTDQAEADKRIAQAKAEERRAMAVALEQENVARVQEMRSKVVEAEAQVPLALAEAFKNGKLGVMDYYNMQNLQADTGMRGAISESAKRDSSK
jgi:uncharacterized protein YqfA (UPF0365 family)